MGNQKLPRSGPAVSGQKVPMAERIAYLEGILLCDIGTSRTRPLVLSTEFHVQ